MIQRILATVLTVLHIEVAAAGDNESTATVSYQWIPRTGAGEEMASCTIGILRRRSSTGRNP